MTLSVDDINWRRLLVHCEKKAHQSSVDSWTGSEKSKFASYVEYLHRRSYTRTPQYLERLSCLDEIVSKNRMNASVEEGVEEARISKKATLLGLQELQTPDPEWLSSPSVVPEHEPSTTTQSTSATVAPDVAKELSPLPSPDQSIPTSLEQTKTSMDGALRHRRRRAPSRSREEETRNVEEMLKYHRDRHDALTDDLRNMATQLKLNSLAFGDTLTKDSKILQDAQEAVSDNLGRMRNEKDRLDKHYNKSWSTSLMSCSLIFFVCIVFVLVFLTIKLLPKA